MALSVDGRTKPLRDIFFENLDRRAVIGQNTAAYRCMHGCPAAPGPVFLSRTGVGMKKGVNITSGLGKESDEQAKNNGSGLIIAAPPPQLLRSRAFSSRETRLCAFPSCRIFGPSFPRAEEGGLFLYPQKFPEANHDRNILPCP
jgi:hypothetical protein